LHLFLIEYIAGWKSKLGLALIVGNLGTGKTLILTILAMLELEDNKKVYSTYHIKYVASNGNTAQFVDAGDLLTYFREQEESFIPNSSCLMVDEGYLGTDSRQSSSSANKLMTDFVLQSRHFGLDLYFCVQLASTIDKRIRKLIDARVLAEKLWRKTVGDDGNEKLEPMFKYTYMSASGETGNLQFSNENVSEIYPQYDHMEIVEAPMISLDHRIAVRTKKLLTDSSIKKRRKMKITIKR